MPDDEWYVPPAWEAEPSAVPGMSRGEFERLADQILWFRSLTLEQRLASFERHRDEQRWFDTLRMRPHEGSRYLDPGLLTGYAGVGGAMSRWSVAVAILVVVLAGCVPDGGTLGATSVIPSTSSSGHCGGFVVGFASAAGEPGEMRISRTAAGENDAKDLDISVMFTGVDWYLDGPLADATGRVHCEGGGWGPGTALVDVEGQVEGSPVALRARVDLYCEQC